MTSPRLMRAQPSSEFAYRPTGDVLRPAFDLDGRLDVSYSADRERRPDVDPAIAGVASDDYVVKAKRCQKGADQSFKGLRLHLRQRVLEAGPHFVIVVRYRSTERVSRKGEAESGPAVLTEAAGSPEASRRFTSV